MKQENFQIFRLEKADLLSLHAGQIVMLHLDNGSLFGLRLIPEAASLHHCPLCPRQLGSAKGLAHHMTRRHSQARMPAAAGRPETPEELPYQCKKCHRRFATPQSLGGHHMNHASPARRKLMTQRAIENLNKARSAMRRLRRRSR